MVYSALVSTTLSAITATLKVQVTILAGVLLALFNVLNVDVSKGIQQLTYTTLIPALLFSKVASTVTPQTLRSLSFVGFFACLNISVGVGLGALFWYAVQRWTAYQVSKRKRLALIVELDSVESGGSDEDQADHPFLFQPGSTDIESGAQEGMFDVAGLEKGQFLSTCAFANTSSIALALIEGIYPAQLFKAEYSLAVSYSAVYIAVAQIWLYTLGQTLAGGRLPSSNELSL